MSLGAPWADLGLSRVCVRVADEVLWLEDGAPCPEFDVPVVDGLPCAAYPLRRDDVPPDGAIDLRLLARVLHPTCSDHSLAAIAALHGIEASGASAAAGVLAAMLEEAVGLDRELIALLARLLPGPLAGLFDRILLQPLPERAPEAQGSTAEARELELGDIAATDVLGAGGIVAGALASYEERSGQLEMAEAVQEAFRDGEALLVEAGPGTGKTFAYLVPTILYLRGDASARVIVSTRTKPVSYTHLRAHET